MPDEAETARDDCWGSISDGPPKGLLDDFISFRPAIGRPPHTHPDINRSIHRSNPRSPVSQIRSTHRPAWCLLRPLAWNRLTAHTHTPARFGRYIYLYICIRSDRQTRPQPNQPTTNPPLQHTKYYRPHAATGASQPDGTSKQSGCQRTQQQQQHPPSAIEPRPRHRCRRRRCRHPLQQQQQQQKQENQAGRGTHGQQRLGPHRRRPRRWWCW